MPSTSVTIAVIFFVMLGFFGIMMWIDGRTTYIFPRKFNYSDGKSESDGQHSEAEHVENKETGEMTAKASVGESGNASATAEFGYEYQNNETQPISLVVKIAFEYQVKLESDSDQSKVTGKVETVVNSKSASIADESLNEPGTLSSPEGGEVIKHNQSNSVTLQPGEKFIAYLRLTANAVATATGNCVGQVSGKVTEISYRPQKIIL